MQRVYGTAWETFDQLKVYKKRQEEAKRRDHRVLGKKLGLFSIQEDAGGGLVFWHAKGGRVRKLIEDYWKQQHVEVGIEVEIDIQQYLLSHIVVCVSISCIHPYPSPTHITTFIF